MKPSSMNCRKSECAHLQSVKIETVNGPRASWYCDKTGKIPGNMGKCPLEETS